VQEKEDQLPNNPTGNWAPLFVTSSLSHLITHVQGSWSVLKQNQAHMGGYLLENVESNLKRVQKAISDRAERSLVVDGVCNSVNSFEDALHNVGNELLGWANKATESVSTKHIAQFTLATAASVIGLGLLHQKLKRRRLAVPDDDERRVRHHLVEDQEERTESQERVASNDDFDVDNSDEASENSPGYDREIQSMNSNEANETNMLSADEEETQLTANDEDDSAAQILRDNELCRRMEEEEAYARALDEAQDAVFCKRVQQEEEEEQMKIKRTMEEKDARLARQIADSGSDSDADSYTYDSGSD